MKYITIIIALMLCHVTMAQSYIKNNVEPHGYDSRTIELFYLFKANGQGGEGIFSKTSSKGLIKQIGLSYDNGEFASTQTKYNIYTGHYSILKPLFHNDNESFYFNAGGGGYLSYETMKNEILGEKKNKFSPGILVKVEIEYYINRVGLAVNAQQLYKPLSEIADWQWRLGVGLKYIIK